MGFFIVARFGHLRASDGLGATTANERAEHRASSKLRLVCRRDTAVFAVIFPQCFRGFCLEPTNELPR